MTALRGAFPVSKRPRPLGSKALNRNEKSW